MAKPTIGTEPEGFTFPIEPGVAIGEYASKVNIFLKVVSLFRVTMQAKFKVWVEEMPD